MQEDTRQSLRTPIFYVQKQKEAKQGRKVQLGRVMHQRARGHEAERSHSIFYIQQQKEITIREYRGFIRNIMRRYVRISSFFVQKCGEEKRNVRLIQGRTEILRLYFYFSGKIDWKIKDIFLKKENLKGLSTYIYGEKYCLTCKTVWVQFKTVLRRQWKRHRKYDMLFYKGSFETGV